MIGWLLAETVATPFDWGEILKGAVGGSPIAGLLLWRLYVMDKDAKQQQTDHRAESATLRAEYAAEVARNRAEQREAQDRALALAERMAPLLSDATKLVGEMKSGLEASMRGGESTVDLRKLMGQLESLTRRLDPDAKGRQSR